MKNHNKQNKKNRKKDLLAVVLLIAGLLLFGASIVWGLGRQQPEIAENPVQGISADSSFKGYLGKGFAYAGADTDNQNGAESTEVQAQTLEEPEEPETEEEEEQEPEQQITENPDNSRQTVDNTAGEPEETSEQAEGNQETDEEVLPNEVHYDDENNDDGQRMMIRNLRRKKINIHLLRQILKTEKPSMHRTGHFLYRLLTIMEMCFPRQHLKYMETGRNCIPSEQMRRE